MWVLKRCNYNAINLLYIYVERMGAALLVRIL
jgi:hypothetical protein